MNNCDSVVLNDKAQSLLNSLIGKLGIQNYTLNITPGNIRGDNYLGVIAKVEVKTKNASWYWIVKCAPVASQFREFVPITNVYGREAYMYEIVLSEYEKLQEEKNVSTPFRSYPKYYTSLIAEPYETIIMEDMKAVGYKLGNREEPLDYNHVLLVMREYGRFHALSFALQDQNPNLFKEIQNNMGDLYYDVFIRHDGSKKIIIYQCDQVIDSFEEDTSNKAAYDKFINFKEHMFERMGIIFSPEAAGLYVTISHGDSWINNLLFKYSESQGVISMCFIDWQMARIGSPVLDLSYFLFSSTDKKLRDRYYESLLKEYYHSFSSFLLELGSDPDALYPFYVFQEQLKKFSVFGLFMAVQVVYYMLSDKDEIPDMHNFEDEEEAMEQMKFIPKNVDKYLSRMKDLIVDMDKLNYDF